MHLCLLHAAALPPALRGANVASTTCSNLRPHSKRRIVLPQHTQHLHKWLCNSADVITYKHASLGGTTVLVQISTNRHHTNTSSLRTATTHASTLPNQCQNTAVVNLLSSCAEAPPTSAYSTGDYVN